jgi:hypothetical protein
VAGVALALALVFATSGCVAPQRMASSSTTPAGLLALGYVFNPAVSSTGPAATTTETPLVVPWFPPPGTDGLRHVVDATQLAELSHAAMATPEFWAGRSDGASPTVVFGDSARKLMSAGGGFTEATIVPVRPLTTKAPGPTEATVTSLLGKPSSFQVFLSGPAGLTSFGLRPSGRSGEWLLDPRGELYNWPSVIDALGRSVGFVATSAVVTHGAYLTDAKRVLYLSWAIFRDAGGREVAIALRDMPLTGDTWTLGGQPLGATKVFPSRSIFETVTATPSN